MRVFLPIRKAEDDEIEGDFVIFVDEERRGETQRGEANSRNDTTKKGAGDERFASFSQIIKTLPSKQERIVVEGIVGEETDTELSSTCISSELSGVVSPTAQVLEIARSSLHLKGTSLNQESRLKPKQGRLKTTGLYPSRLSSGIKPSIASSLASSRKRRSTGSADHRPKTRVASIFQAETLLSSADSKPKARIITKGSQSNSSRNHCSPVVLPNNIPTMVSGERHPQNDGFNNGENSRQWKYFDHTHDDNGACQDVDDPGLDEFPEMMREENDPDSARGDPRQSLTPFAVTSETRNHVVSTSRTTKQSSSLHLKASALSNVDKPSHEATYEDFVAALKKRGLEISEQDGDGNCLFRAISLQVYGDPSMHGDVRKKCMDFMERDQEHFAQFVTGEPFSQYISRKRQDGVHGNNPEIQAISELFNRPIEVFTPENGASPLNIFHAEYKTDDAPIRLSYHDGNHYNAVVDPLVPTAGLGLGLPGLQPGLADKLQMAKAVAESDADADKMELQRVIKESEEDEIQRTMKETEDDELQRAIKLSKMSADSLSNDRAASLSDIDATYEQLEQAALVESLRSLDQGRKMSASKNPPRLGQCDASTGLTLPSSTPGQMEEASLGSVAAAASLPAASMPSESSFPSCAFASPVRPVEEYPNTVQELVMNGFELRDVLKAFDLVGDNFDDLLTLLISRSS